LDDGNTALIFVLVVSMFLSAFFSAAQTAFSSLNKIRLRNLINAGNQKAVKILQISDNNERALAAILIGNVIANVVSASIGTIIFSNLFGDAGIWISMFIVALFILIFCESFPKSLAKQSSEKFAASVSGLLGFFMFILTPFVSLYILLQHSTRFHKTEGNHPSVTEEELKYFIEEIEDQGVLEEQESELVQSALDFDEVTADEILTPRVDVISVDIEDSIEEIKNVFIAERYSRIPVYEKNMDNVVGILHEKDFFKSYLENPKNVDISAIMQSTVYIPPKKKISELLKELQKLKSHIAVVTDQYGGTLGIVTLEDILEQLVGEIWDEDDEVVQDVLLIAKDQYKVNPDMNIYTLFEEIDFNCPEFKSNSNSVGGWVLETFERIPKQNESFRYKTLEVIVSEVEEQRIISLIIQKDPQI
jgi:CBS domain containing-hemolysin-like protein